jgi:phospholipid/cholesterol/gamma-HCH transport system substrate-binding protein
MKQEQINYFAVGSFVLAMLLLLVFSIYKIMGRDKDADVYYLTLKNVSGIREGTAVTYAGFQIGKVIDIAPLRENNQTHYQLKLGVKSGWPIPADSSAQITSPGLLAEKQIDINEGHSTQLAAAGQTIAGVESADMFKLMSDVSTQFQTLSEQGLKPLFATINNEITSNIPALVTQTTQLLQQLNSSANQFSRLLSSTQPERLGKVVDNAEQITQNLGSMSVRLNDASAKIDKLLTDTHGVMHDNNDSIHAAVSDLRRSMQVVSDNINSIVYNLDATTRNMNEFSRQLRDNPAVLLNNKPPVDDVVRQQ